MRSFVAAFFPRFFRAVVAPEMDPQRAVPYDSNDAGTPAGGQ